MSEVDAPYTEAAFYAIGRQLAQMRKGMTDSGMKADAADRLLQSYVIALVNRQQAKPEEAEDD